jgi:hypothetical protein
VGKGTVPRQLARLAAGALLLVLAAGSSAARAQSIGEDLARELSDAQQRAYVLYLRARAQFDRDLDAYWRAVDEAREARKRKRATSQPFIATDYIQVQPPAYRGPPLPPDVAKIIAKVRPPSLPAEPIPILAEFLAHARTEFGFVPQTTTEAEFKRRYAEEALALGLTKDQVVRVFALETGGRGTFDMQAGIDPETRKGTAISTALGYAQLLAANSVNELTRHGDAFINRLETVAARPETPRARAHQLRAKAATLRRMVRAARSVPNAWASHVAFARQPKGLAIHALNLDADIGPWLQTIKLKGVRDHAEKAGRTNLSGAEIELMNLAGPQTGLDMMEPVALAVPTSNFFARAAYYRNPIVKDRSSAELLKALDDRMNQNLVRPGSVAFAQAFDQAAGVRRRSAER